ncbi:MAG: GNAT family N-acetyltransferase [Crocinitomicaceae bacterium]|tara:strand:+ start:623 stop:1582 length:960 start_codon:yes stop_codon:yes gene_type:complete
MNDYSIHKLREEDFSLIIPLMLDCFGLDVDIDYFKWKFIENPSGLVEGYYAKDSKGVVSAYYGVIPETFVINGERRIIYQSCDTMTHSKHRRKGLFKKLALECYKSLRNENKLFVYGFGGGQSTPGFLKFGWDKIFKVKYYFYPKHFNLFSSLKNNSVYEITDLKKIVHLTIKSNESIKVHSLKNYEIYKWRLSNPRHSYKTIAFQSKDGTYSGYITYYKEDNKIVIFDFFALDREANKNLFNYLKSSIKTGDKGVIAFCQENCLYSITLRKNSFITNPFKIGPLNEKIPFIFYAMYDEQVILNDSKAWLINSFEHDAL